MERSVILIVGTPQLRETESPPQKNVYDFK